MESFTLRNIITIINQIGEKHKSFSENYYKDKMSFNLKSLTITKIIDNESYDNRFFDAVTNYIHTLMFEDLSEDIQYDALNIILRNRVKYEDSAFNKIYYYRFGKPNPAVPLKKCMNDLNGFRIIVDDDFEYEELLHNILNDKNLTIKFSRNYVRRENNYQAIHLNIMNGKNIYFPWEIQIWNKKDQYQNEESHKEHKAKRKYIKWTPGYFRRRY